MSNDRYESCRQEMMPQCVLPDAKQRIKAAIERAYSWESTDFNITRRKMFQLFYFAFSTSNPELMQYVEDTETEIFNSTRKRRLVMIKPDKYVLEKLVRGETVFADEYDEYEKDGIIYLTEKPKPEKPKPQTSLQKWWRNWIW